MKIKPTEGESRGGWTADLLEKYRQERDLAANVVAGNVITEFKRPKAPMQIQGARSYNPHNWR